jgi:hypothetical protein
MKTKLNILTTGCSDCQRKQAAITGLSRLLDETLKREKDLLNQNDHLRNDLQSLMLLLEAKQMPEYVPRLRDAA